MKSFSPRRHSVTLVSSLLWLTLAGSALLRGQTTVPAQTVNANQTLIVTDPTSITTSTSGPVEVKPGATAVFVTPGAIVLKPGFRAETGSRFGAFIDVDNDGMADSWEAQHGFNPASAADASADADGDDVPNVVEYLLGTNPRVARQSDTTNTLGLKVTRPN